MEDLIIGTLTVNTSLVIPHPNNVRVRGNITPKDREFRYKSVKLHSYFEIDRSDCAQLKAHFLDQNPQYEEGDLAFVFQVTEYI